MVPFREIFEQYNMNSTSYTASVVEEVVRPKSIDHGI